MENQTRNLQGNKSHVNLFRIIPRQPLHPLQTTKTILLDYQVYLEVNMMSDFQDIEMV